jgi:hypothetical protein
MQSSNLPLNLRGERAGLLGLVAHQHVAIPPLSMPARRKPKRGMVRLASAGPICTIKQQQHHEQQQQQE